MASIVVPPKPENPADLTPIELLADTSPVEIFELPACNDVWCNVLSRPLGANVSSEQSLWATAAGCIFVAPYTNATAMSLWYQAYLNVIFHRTRFAFYGHATTMPCCVTFILAWAASYQFSSGGEEWANWIDMNFVLALGFFIWYTIWGCMFKIWWFGPCALPILTICYLGGHYYHHLGHSAKFHPLLVSLICAGLQSITHLLEDLPPRVGGALTWTLKSDFACRQVDSCCELFTRGFRMVLTALVWGTIDEWVASPRLLPLFYSLWPMKTIMYCTGCSCCGTLETMERYFGKVDGSTEGLFKQALKPVYRVQAARDPNNGGIPKVEPLDPNLNSFGRCCQWLAYDACCEEKPKQPFMIANPALDYVGVGGATILQVDQKVSCMDALCCKYNIEDIQLNRRAGALQIWLPCYNEADVPVVGVSAKLPGGPTSAPAPAGMNTAAAALSSAPSAQPADDKSHNE